MVVFAQFTIFLHLHICSIYDYQGAEVSKLISLCHPANWVERAATPLDKLCALNL